MSCAPWWSGSVSWLGRAPQTRQLPWPRWSRPFWPPGQSARDDKDFATSDRLRDALIAGGIVVKDTPDGVDPGRCARTADDEGPGCPTVR